ncbi:MAG TPA: tRNA (adenosine(37)-N6)-threonylcarbamoyltransferase complex dimerization subunit type 1 TsaB [Jatrophihabitantaceae bacterium]
MLVLAIDTSSAAVTAAVVAVDDAVRALAQRVTVDARAHGERLAPSIAECLADAGAAPGDLDAIVAGVGPGPFTGLRVGLVTAAAMADALTVPAYGVCSLDAIAAAAPSSAAPSEGRTLVATDARRREVFWARYADGVRVDGPDVAKPADVSTVDSAVMAGAGARLYADVLGLPLLDVDYPDPTALVRLAAPRIRANAPTEALTPLYLRRPDAVEPGARKAVSQ